MRHRFPGCLLPCLLLLSMVANGFEGTEEPFADIHVHYNWDQKELISADRVAEKLVRQNVELAVVSGTPSRLALELARAAGNRVVPFFSPYTHALGRQTWFRDADVLRQAEEGLRGGGFEGIGEVHFMTGFRPRIDNTVFLGLVDLAKRYDVPILVHVDAGSEVPFRELCASSPGVRFIFAHAGGNLLPAHVRSIVEACDNVLVEFSARDPWRYGGLTGEKGFFVDSVARPGAGPSAAVRNRHGPGLARDPHPILGSSR